MFIQEGTWEALVAVSAAVTTFVDTVKPYLAGIKERDARLHDILILAIRFIASLVGVIAAGEIFGIFSGIENYTVAAQVVFIGVTAFAVGMGAEFLNVMRNILSRFKPAEFAKVEAVSSEPLSVIVETTAPASLPQDEALG